LFAESLYAGQTAWLHETRRENASATKISFFITANLGKGQVKNNRGKACVWIKNLFGFQGCLKGTAFFYR